MTAGPPGPVHDRRTDELRPQSLLALLQLRIDVFVVEQRCPYPELDGRDGEPATRHLWIEDPVGRPAAYLRLLDDGGARRIGRVVTRQDRRRRGLAQTLVTHAIGTSVGPWVLDAQAHLEGWYETLGFRRSGPPFVEDGIPHVPMRRET